MKNLVVFSCILVVTTTQCHAFLGIEKMLKGIIGVELTAVKQDIKGDLVGIKGDITGVKADIGSISTKVDSVIKAQVTAQGIAGVGNQQTAVNGDLIQRITNDSKLMEYNIKMWQNTCKEWKGICASLIAILFWVIRQLFKVMDKSKFYTTELALKSKPEDWGEIQERKKEALNKSIFKKILKKKEIISASNSPVMGKREV